MDYTFLLAVGLLMAFGLVMLFSAGSARALANFGDSLWYFKQQLKGVVFGLVLMFVFSNFDYHKLGKWAMLLLAGSAFLLFLVILPGVGTTINGATRWLFGFQPSEIAKFAIILYFAFSLSKNYHKLSDFRYGLCPYLGILLVFILLLMLEPHFSCIVLMGLTSVLLLFVAGAKIKHFVWLSVPAVLGVIGLIIAEPYRMKRIISFMDPFADAQGAGFQIVQSLYAIGSGGIFGVGLGQSRQKYLALPEPQNDFIFSVLAEELGLLGAAILIGLFIFLIVRGIKIAVKAPDLFGTLLVTGIVGIIAFQAMINIAVVTASIPVTGMPLPFFSFGSTALTITLAEMGIVLNVSRQIKKPL
ncbi:MAG: putative lipid II flippase FtsW [Clostridia bacterium]|nr:putative lipid II flippase FtsW [Clostridia bacterium]